MSNNLMFIRPVFGINVYRYKKKDNIQIHIL